LSGTTTRDSKEIAREIEDTARKEVKAAPVYTAVAEA